MGESLPLARTSLLATPSNGGDGSVKAFTISPVTPPVFFYNKMDFLMKKSFFLAIIVHLSFITPNSSFLTPNFLFAQVASASETLPARKVGTDEMLPVLADDVLDGDYEIEVESSSSMFRIVQSVLHVKEGKMTARLTLSGKGYSKLFLGTAEEASTSKGEGEILPVSLEQIEGQVAFDIPVSALNTPVKCAAFSKRKSKWYDRDILFYASSLPQEKLLVSPEKPQKIQLKNGTYRIKTTLTGGSGRSSITDPAYVVVKDGLATAEIEWSSPNYDYMKVNNVRYDVDSKILDKGGNSTFMIPVYSFGKKMPVTADTVAMSKSHEIHYWLEFDLNSAKKAKKKK